MGVQTVRKAARLQEWANQIRDQGRTKGILELVWDPGPAQVDFGETDVYEDGVLVRMHYLTLSFPYSNDGFSQFFCKRQIDHHLENCARP